MLKIARRLDSSPKFIIREEPNALILELSQPRRVRYTAEKPVNVSSVPHRSPFRYPGGKTWLVPYIRDWLRSKSQPPALLIEPFAGGAIVSLTVAFERLAKHVVFCELDEDVASVWRVVLNGHAEWLAKQILTFDLTLENVRETLKNPTSDVCERAFQTILRNRVQRGGIMAPGAGLVKNGEKGRGLGSRWYPDTLARRFYRRWKIDHSRLFSLLRDCEGDFLMSYDNTVEVAEMAKKYGFETSPIAMKNTHHAKMTELLIGRDLSWLQGKH